MASVTVTLDDADVTQTTQDIIWEPIPRPSVAAVSESGTAVLAWLLLSRTTVTERVRIRLANNQTDPSLNALPDFTEMMEIDGTIEFAASNGSSVVIPGPGALGNTIVDVTEPYSYFTTTTQMLEVRALANEIVTLSDRSITHHLRRQPRTYGELLQASGRRLRGRDSLQAGERRLRGRDSLQTSGRHLRPVAQS